MIAPLSELQLRAHAEGQLAIDQIVAGIPDGLLNARRFVLVSATLLKSLSPPDEGAWLSLVGIAAAALSRLKELEEV